MGLFGSEDIILQNGRLVYIENFYTPAESDRIFKDLRQNTPWQEEVIKMYGKEITCPRRMAWYGDKGTDYVYSGIMHHPLPLTPTLTAIKQKVEEQAQHKFNSVLLNLYRDGKDSMSWHSDDEKELGINPTIASISFGAERIFKLKHKTDKTLKADILLKHGSLLIMTGELQHYWQHSIPKTAKPIAERINLTFREIRNIG
jgi:alkylated DNA repair dioxygenase AlkB